MERCAWANIALNGRRLCAAVRARPGRAGPSSQPNRLWVVSSASFAQSRSTGGGGGICNLKANRMPDRPLPLAP
jgi:hypothetical protein